MFIHSPGAVQRDTSYQTSPLCVFCYSNQIIRSSLPVPQSIKIFCFPLFLYLLNFQVIVRFYKFCLLVTCPKSFDCLIPWFSLFLQLSYLWNFFLKCLKKDEKSGSFWLFNQLPSWCIHKENENSLIYCKTNKLMPLSHTEISTKTTQFTY